MTNDEFDKLLTEQARPTMEELARQSQELRMGYEVADRYRTKGWNHDPCMGRVRCDRSLELRCVARRLPIVSCSDALDATSYPAAGG